MKRLASLLVLIALSCVPVVGADYYYSEDDYPPDAYIATVTPYYYGGYPYYYWHDHWYRREHGQWRYYRDEPGHLREYRARTPPPPRAYYGRGHTEYRGYPSRREHEHEEHEREEHEHHRH